MKYLRSFETYDITGRYKRDETNIFYFKSPKNNYEVKISPYQGREFFYSVGFGVSKHLGYDTDIIVNENPYEVMDTVFTIMKQFIDELRNDEFIRMFDLEPIKGFIFSLTGDKEKNKQRLKLYQRNIDKHFPEAKLELKNGIYYIEL